DHQYRFFLIRLCLMMTLFFFLKSFYLIYFQTHLAYSWCHKRSLLSLPVGSLFYFAYLNYVSFHPLLYLFTLFLLSAFLKSEHILYQLFFYLIHLFDNFYFFAL